MPAANPRVAPAALPLALSLLGSLAAAASGPSGPSAARLWIDGDAAAALAALKDAEADRARDLNRAVVRLYAGDAEGAESLLTSLLRSEPRWTPALRWLSRTQRELARPAAVDSAAALLASPDVVLHDWLWAGRLFLEHGEAGRAREAFAAAVRAHDGIEAGWLGLAEAEARLGNAMAAREAELRGELLRGTPSAGPELARVSYSPIPVPPGLRPGETLRYRVKYLFLNLATVTLETSERVTHRGRPAHRVVFSARSNDGVPFFHIDSRFESVVGLDGALLAHRHTASDSDAGDDEAGYDMDPDTRRCTVRTARDGLFGYDVLPLPPNGQDGVSVLLVARALARARASAVVPTVVESLWWPTRLTTLGTERIRWEGREVETVRLRSEGRYRGPGGLSGGIDLWVSHDERAVPYKVRMKVAVGSVVLQLLPDEDEVPSQARADVAKGSPQ